jgi:hypothetical protein
MAVERKHLERLEAWKKGKRYYQKIDLTVQEEYDPSIPPPPIIKQYRFTEIGKWGFTGAAFAGLTSLLFYQLGNARVGEAARDTAVILMLASVIAYSSELNL